MLKIDKIYPLKGYDYKDLCIPNRLRFKTMAQRKDTSLCLSNIQNFILPD